jgi:hypothetical protein
VASTAPKIALAAGALAAAGLIVFLLARDGDPEPAPSPGTPSAADAPKAAPDSRAAPAQTYASPRDEFAARRDALPIDDVPGRLDLAAFCAENKLRNERLDVLREVLLLQPQNEAACRELGFRKYTGSAAAYKGMWLSPVDHGLALGAEKLGDMALGGTARSGAARDLFAEDVARLEATLVGEFPKDRFEYRADDGVMPRPYLAVLQTGAGIDVAEQEAFFGKRLKDLYTVFFERYRERFGLADVTEPIPVVVFGSKAAYDNWQARHPEYPTSESIGAYYLPAAKRLMLWNTGDPDFVGTLFHEGTHQLMHFTVGEFHSPWLQEGFAEFFGGHEIEQVFDPVTGALVNRYRLGRFLKDRYAALQAAIRAGSAMTVKELVHRGYAEFGADQAAQETDSAAAHRVSLTYAQGWGLIMYLHYADGGRHLEGFEKLVEAEAAGTASGETFGATFGLVTDEDWAAFDAAFESWVLDDLQKL